MDRWWQRPWLRFHATIAPFGISATTLLLTLYLEQWQWQGRASWELAGDLVDLGAALYGMVAVLGERGIIIMLWALDKRREWREKWRAEARAEGLAEGRAEVGPRAGRRVGRGPGPKLIKRYEERLERIAAEAREKGITLESLNGLDPDTE